MKFIIETGPRHPGAKLYVCLKPGSRREFELRGYRDQAFEFGSRAIAPVFQSLPARPCEDRMTPTQYKKALDQVGLSIGKAGDFLGFTRRQSFRIAAGEAEVPESARKLLLLMLDGKLTYADVIARIAR
jgi:hypothetical protein